METIDVLYKAERIRTTVSHHGPFKTLADVEKATPGSEHATASGSAGTTRDDSTGPLA